MHFSLSLLSEYLNIDEGISKKSPLAGQAFRRPGDLGRKVDLGPEAAPACSNSMAVVKILELGICEIQLLISDVCRPFARENLVEHVK